ncbi:hypothetical protein EDB86DRAFT_2326582 [Lactarius hatsudake]|nr:hypothetical protein EDB86DRAFT_2326582 [Lactarius hatsudake]
MGTSARYTLDFPMILEDLSDELSLFEGWALRDLVRYRRRCRDGLVSTLQSFLAPPNIWVVCTADSLGSYSIRTVFPRWLQDIFLRHIQTSLQDPFTDPLLKPSSIRGEYLAALNTHVTSQNCLPCMKVHTLKGETFCEELERKLTRALDEVRRIPDRGERVHSLNPFLGIRDAIGTKDTSWRLRLVDLSRRQKMTMCSGWFFNKRAQKSTATSREVVRLLGYD